MLQLPQVRAHKQSLQEISNSEIRAGHLWCQVGSILTNLSLIVNSGSYCTSAIVGR